MDRPGLDNIIIRAATPADTVAVGKLWEKLVAHHQKLDPVLPRAAPDGAALYARNLNDRLYDTHTRVFVAEFEGKLIGYVLGVVVDLVPEMFEQEAGGFLADIYVDEMYRGHGTGRALVKALAAWFRQHNLTYFEWHVAAANSDALAFWKAMQGRELMIRMRTDIGEDGDDGTSVSDR